MKKITMLICALVFVMPVIFNNYAQAGYDDEYVEVGTIENAEVIDADGIPDSETPVNKLKRGLLNGATFWLELPAEMAKVSKEQDAIQGVTVGVVKGLITSVMRFGSAGVEVVTCGTPSYDKPLMKPEYAYQKADLAMREIFW